MSSELIQRHTEAVSNVLKGNLSGLKDIYLKEDVQKDVKKDVKEEKLANAFADIRFNKNLSLDQFNTKQFLGKGAFGEVYLAEHKDTGLNVAIKKLTKSKMDRDNFMIEVNNMKHVQNQCEEYLLCFLNTFETPDYFVLISEALVGFIDYWDFIRDNMNKLQFTTIMEIWSKMVNGLEILHNLNMIHSDIKPANIMIHNKTHQIKYIDLGMSCFGIDCYPRGFTPTYYPLWYKNNLDVISFENKKKGDVFALGLTMVEAISIYYPSYPRGHNPSNKYSLFEFKKRTEFSAIRTFFFNPVEYTPDELNFTKVILFLTTYFVKEEMIPLSLLKKIIQHGDSQKSLDLILDNYNVKDRSLFKDAKVSSLMTMNKLPDTLDFVDIMRSGDNKTDLRIMAIADIDS